MNRRDGTMVAFESIQRIYQTDPKYGAATYLDALVMKSVYGKP